MNRKELLLKLKKFFQNEQVIEEEKETLPSKYDLNLKIQDFLKWSVSKEFVDNERILENFIDKLAIWYELRYPSFKIRDILFNKHSNYGLEEIQNSQSYQDISSILNDDEQITMDTITSLTKWDDLFDFKTLFKLLDYQERMFFKRPKFEERYIFKEGGCIYFTSNGRVKEIEGKYKFDNYSYLDFLKPFKGQMVNQIIPILSEYDMNYDASKIQELIDEYKDRLIFKEKLLDSILYKIILRGHEMDGALRGFLFAKEFERNLDIPMTYIPNLSHFNGDLINVYLKLGGSLDLICCPNAFYNNYQEVKLEKIYQKTSITKEEKELFQRIINVLNQKVLDHEDELKKEKVQEKRIEKRLRRSKNRQL